MRRPRYRFISKFSSPWLDRPFAPTTSTVASCSSPKLFLSLSLSFSPPFFFNKSFSLSHSCLFCPSPRLCFFSTWFLFLTRSAREKHTSDASCSLHRDKFASLGEFQKLRDTRGVCGISEFWEIWGDLANLRNLGKFLRVFGKLENFGKFLISGRREISEIWELENFSNLRVGKFQKIENF